MEDGQESGIAIRPLGERRTQGEHRPNGFMSRSDREAVCKGECWNLDISRRFYAHEPRNTSCK